MRSLLHHCQSSACIIRPRRAGSSTYESVMVPSIFVDRALQPYRPVPGSALLLLRLHTARRSTVVVQNWRMSVVIVFSQELPSSIHLITCPDGLAYLASAAGELSWS